MVPVILVILTLHCNGLKVGKKISFNDSNEWQHGDHDERVFFEEGFNHILGSGTEHHDGVRCGIKPENEFKLGCSCQQHGLQRKMRQALLERLRKKEIA